MAAWLWSGAPGCRPRSRRSAWRACGCAACPTCLRTCRGCAGGLQGSGWQVLALQCVLICAPRWDGACRAPPCLLVPPKHLALHPMPQPAALHQPAGRRPAGRAVPPGGHPTGAAPQRDPPDQLPCPGVAWGAALNSLQAGQRLRAPTNAAASQQLVSGGVQAGEVERARTQLLRHAPLCCVPTALQVSTLTSLQVLYL